LAGDQSYKRVGRQEVLRMSIQASMQLCTEAGRQTKGRKTSQLPARQPGEHAGWQAVKQGSSLSS
jgi:hypothetical protein